MNAWFSFSFRYLLTGIIVSLLLIVFVPRPTPTTRSQTPEASRKERRLARERKAVDRIADDGKHFMALLEEVVPESEQDMYDQGSTTSDTPPPASGVQHDPVQAAASPSARWGVVVRPKTSFYTTAGAFLGHLPPGELMDIITIKENRGQRLALCRHPSTPQTPTILVRADDIEVHSGQLAAISYELQRLYAEQANLKIEIDTLSAQHETHVRADNPYGRAYAKAREEYQDYWSRVTKLKEGRDSSEGADRVHYANELRKLKGRDITLRTNMDHAKEKYDEWNLQHPDAISADTGLASLRKELDSVERQIQSRSTIK